MAEQKIKFGFLTTEEIRQALIDKIVNPFDVLYNRTNHVQYIVLEDYTLFEIKAKVPIFVSIDAAIEAINKDKSYYPGELLSILVDEEFVAYTINGTFGNYTVKKVCSQSDFTYDDLQNVPIKNVGTKITDKVVIADLPDGCYKANYFICPTGTEVSSVVGNFFIIAEHDGAKHIKRITQNSIIDYVIGENGQLFVDKYVTEEYLKDNGYITNDILDKKLEAFKIAIEEYIKDYVQTTCEYLIKHMINEELDRRYATNEDIRNIFNTTE